MSPEKNAEGVLYAMDFLSRMNSGEKVALGEKVIVIGGGSVAIDAARVAKRLGATESSYCLSGMPGPGLHGSNAGPEPRNPRG